MKDDKKSIKNDILKCLKNFDYIHYIQYKKVYDYILKNIYNIKRCINTLKTLKSSLC